MCYEANRSEMEVPILANFLFPVVGHEFAGGSVFVVVQPQCHHSVARVMMNPALP
jgi:hypothetical protein